MVTGFSRNSREVRRGRCCMLCTGKLKADSTGGQSSNLIHIQMTPLHSLDSYASNFKLKTEGMEVAIYSGSCPLTCLACPQPSRTLQHQVCPPAAVLCVCLLLVALHSLPTISSVWQVFCAVTLRCALQVELLCPQVQHSSLQLSNSPESKC